MKCLLKGFIVMVILFVVVSIAQAKPTTLNVTVYIATLPDFKETVPYETYESIEECKVGLDDHVAEELIRLPDAKAAEVNGNIAIQNEIFLAVAECVEDK